jgi:hypothetical protein
MLETNLVALQDISLEKILDDNGRKIFCSDIAEIMQQVIPMICFILHSLKQVLQFSIAFSFN